VERRGGLGGKERVGASLVFLYRMTEKPKERFCFVRRLIRDWRGNGRVLAARGKWEGISPI